MNWVPAVPCQSRRVPVRMRKAEKPLRANFMGAEKPPSFPDVRMRGFRERTEVDDVLSLLKSRLSPLPAEEVELREAAGRVLAKEVVAPIPVPGFNRAAMDGYALR